MMKCYLCGRAVLRMLGVLATAAAYGQSVPTFSTEELQIPLAVGQPETGARITVYAPAGMQWEIRTTASVPWLQFRPATGTGIQSVLFAIDGRTLNRGMYSTDVTVRIPGTAIGDSMVVVAHVGNGSTSRINASPANPVVTGYEGNAQAVGSIKLTTASGSTAMPFTITTPGFSWLTVTPNSYTTPATLTVTANQAGLVAHQYYDATITVQPSSGARLRVPVTVYAQQKGPPGAILRAASNPLVFSWESGTALPAPLGVLVEAAGTPGAQLEWYAFAVSNGNWLRVARDGQPAYPPFTVARDLAGRYIRVSVDPSGLSNGEYEGTVRVEVFRDGGSVENPPEYPPQSINVRLVVGTSVPLATSPASLSFDFVSGSGTNQLTQELVVSGTSAVRYDVAVQSAGWLSATPSSGTTAPGSKPISVTVNPAGLADGTYLGSIIVATTTESVTVPVKLTVSSRLPLTPSATSLTFTYVRGSSTNQLTQPFTVSSGMFYRAFSVSAQSTGWLSAAPAAGSTEPRSNTVTAAINPAGLSDGTYHGNIVVTAGAESVTVPVTLIVSTPADVFVLGPAALGFQSVPGGGAQSQTLSVSSRGAGPFGGNEPFNASADSTGNWLSVAPQSGSTPAALTVTATPSAPMGLGSYTGSIRIQSRNTLATQIVPVTLTIAAGISATPTTLAFSGNAGGTAPAAQSVSLTGSSNFTASSSAGWLQVAPTSGTSPATLTVTPAIAGLGAGTHTGTITIGAGGQTIFVSVTLTLAAAVEINVSSASLTFAHQTRPGQAPPPAQTVRVTSPAPAAQFTATVSSGAANWLTVTPAGGTTPQDLSVSVNPAGLPVGSQTGTIIVAGPGGLTQRSITVTLNITNPAVGAITAITNGASFAVGPIAPGLIVTVWGTGCGGGSHGMYGQVTAGCLVSQLGSTRLLFDGLPAPLLYVGETQINAVVPYGIYGRSSTRVQLEVNGVRSEAVEQRVADSAPGIFSADLSGRGPGAVLNQNGTLNSASNPAVRGNVIVFWATGEGLVSPAPQEGQIISADQLRKPSLPVLVGFGGPASEGGVPGIVQYAGSAPGFVSGSLQVNVLIPTDAPTGDNVPLILTIGGASSSASITVAIR